MSTAPRLSERDAIYASLMQQAKDRVLYVSPPYPNERVRSAFLAGYEAALKDLASGQLQLRP